jgi:hypothetical protein
MNLYILTISINHADATTLGRFADDVLALKQAKKAATNMRPFAEVALTKFTNTDVGSVGERVFEWGTHPVQSSAS